MVMSIVMIMEILLLITRMIKKKYKTENYPSHHHQIYAQIKRKSHTPMAFIHIFLITPPSSRHTLLTLTFQHNPAKHGIVNVHQIWQMNKNRLFLVQQLIKNRNFYLNKILHLRWLILMIFINPIQGLRMSKIKIKKIKKIIKKRYRF